MWFDFKRKYKWITVEPGSCLGKPVFKKTGMLTSRISINEILEENPRLSEDMVLEAIRQPWKLIHKAGCS